MQLDIVLLPGTQMQRGARQRPASAVDDATLQREADWLHGQDFLGAPRRLAHDVPDRVTGGANDQIEITDLWERRLEPAFGMSALDEVGFEKRTKASEEPGRTA